MEKKCKCCGQNIKTYDKKKNWCCFNTQCGIGMMTEKQAEKHAKETNHLVVKLEA